MRKSKSCLKPDKQVIYHATLQDQFQWGWGGRKGSWTPFNSFCFIQHQIKTRIRKKRNTGKSSEWFLGQTKKMETNSTRLGIAKGSKVTYTARHLTGHLLCPAITIGHLANKATLSSQVQLESEGSGKDEHKEKNNVTSKTCQVVILEYCRAMLRVSIMGVKFYSEWPSTWVTQLEISFSQGGKK